MNCYELNWTAFDNASAAPAPESISVASILGIICILCFDNDKIFISKKPAI